ncbi:MAG: hypothetical protein GXY83_31660 [Rhodopirellula sp.]|nr:hypothetical protein [Rhodopirellula sp.]
MKRILIFLLVMHSTGPIGAETVRVPVSRDTWFSGVGREADCNLGGAHQLKLKSIQEMSLVDFDPAPLKGRVVRRATLHVRLRGKEIARRVTVGSFSAEWVEGTSPSYEPQQGSSTFNHRRHPDVPWAWPGSDLTAVILGQGGSLWNMGDASAPDATSRGRSGSAIRSTTCWTTTSWAAGRFGATTALCSTARRHSDRSSSTTARPTRLKRATFNRSVGASIPGH